jgi:type IV secretory pathway TrbL component
VVLLTSHLAILVMETGLNLDQMMTEMIPSQMVSALTLSRLVQEFRIAPETALTGALAIVATATIAATVAGVAEAAAAAAAVATTTTTTTITTTTTTATSALEMLQQQSAEKDRC